MATASKATMLEGTGSTTSRASRAISSSARLRAWAGVEGWYRFR